jgi:tyrosinase
MSLPSACNFWRADCFYCLQMADPFTSPGDPIFFLHHTWLDKAWWDWQKRDLPSRLTDISGPNNQNPSVGFPEFPGNVTYEDILFGRPADPNWVDVIPPVAGDPGTVTTLDHVLDTLGLLPNATIRDVMDIRGDYLCVEYL